MAFITKQDISELQNVICKKEFYTSNGSGIIAKFERNFSRYIGRRYCLAQNNGTSTLHAAFFALNLKKGDEVLTPAYTWHSSVSPMLHLGAKPVFCEINPKTWTIEPKDTLSKITNRTKAIVVVHLWGMPAQMDEIMDIAKENNLYVIEDCSHAYGSLYKGKKIGTFGDISCFSMQSSKLLAAGEGGIFCTDNKNFYERALILGHHGRFHSVTNKEYRKYSFTGLGFKYRANPLSIILANLQLKRIDEINKIKNININHFEELIKDIPGITVLNKPDYSKSRSYYEFRFLYDEDIIRYPKKKFIKNLKKKGLPLSNEEYRYRLLHKEPLFNKNSFFNQIDNQKKLPITEKIHSQIVVLDLPYKPNYELIKTYYDSIQKMIQKHTKIYSSDGKIGIKTKLISQFSPVYDTLSLKSPFNSVNNFAIELTLNCNLKCKMCFQKGYRKKVYDKEDMNFEKVKKLLYKSKPKKILLSGGEPLFRTDFFKILDILKRLKTKIHLLTNGSLFDRRAIKRIRGYNNIDMITFSLDYYNAKKHDSLRGKKGSFNSITNTINKLKDEFNLATTSIIFEDNIEDLKRIIHSFSSKGILVKFIPHEFFSKLEIEETKKRLARIFNKNVKEIKLFTIQKEISKNKENKLNQNIKELQEFSKEYKNILFLPYYLNNTNYLNYGNSKIKGICGCLPNKLMRFNNKGYVIVCEKIREILGYPNKQTIREIWNSPVYKKFRQDFLENGAFPICKRCAKFKAY